MTNIVRISISVYARLPMGTSLPSDTCCKRAQRAVHRKVRARYRQLADLPPGSSQPRWNSMRSSSADPDPDPDPTED